MKNTFKLTLAIAAMLLSATICAQNVSFRGGASRLMYDGRYFPALFVERNPVIPSFNIKVGWEDYSDSAFASICNHPEIGIAFGVDGLADAVAANGPGMGNLYCTYVYIDRPLLRLGDFRLGYSAGLGAGFSFSKNLDPVKNPYNIMISLPVNAHIDVGVQANYTVAKKVDCGLGFYFDHYSNGAVKFQNKGYNAFQIAATVGLKNPSEQQKNYRRPEKGHNWDDGFKPGFIFDVQASAGVMAIEAYYDKTYAETGVGVNKRGAKYSLQTAAIYKYCRTHADGLAFDLFVTPFCKEIADADGKGIDYRPISVGVSWLHEFQYNNFTATVGVGRYLYDNDGLAQNKILYQFVHAKYHFKNLSDMYAGLCLKAHKFKAAESAQICIGKRF